MVAVALACVGCEDPDARSADGGSDGETDATSSPTPGPCIRPRYLDDEFGPVPRRLPRLDPSTIERGEDASITGVLSLREDRSTERNYWLGDDEPGVEVRADFVLGAEPSGESEARLTVYVNGRPVEVESEGVPVTHVDVRTVDGRAGADLLLPRDLFVSGGSTVHLLAFWEYTDHPSYAPLVTSVAFLVYRESELPLETFEADRTTRSGDTSDRRAGLPHHASYIWVNEPTHQDRTPAADVPIMVRMQPNPGLETCRPYTEVQSLIVLANGLPLDGWAPGDAGSSYVVAHETASGAVDVEVRIPERILEAERTALNFMVLGGIGAPLQNTVHSGTPYLGIDVVLGGTGWLNP